MKPYFSFVIFVLLMFFQAVSSRFYLFAQTSFALQHWDSLYSKALHENRGVTDTVIEQLMDWTERNSSLYGDSYSKYLLANEFLRYGEWDKSEAYNKEAQAICQNNNKADLDEVCSAILTHTYVLEAQLNQKKGHFHQAVFQYKRIIQAHKEKVDRQRIKCEIGLGEIFLSQGEYLKAYQYFDLAYHLILDHQLGNELAASVLLESSYLMSEAGLDSLASANLKLASDLAKQEEDVQLTIEVLCTEGHNHFIAQRYDDCKKAYEKASVLAENNKQYTSLAIAKTGLGLLALKQRDKDLAKQLFEATIEIAQLQNQKELLAQSQVYLGKLQLQSNQLDSAYLFCSEAYEAASIANMMKTRMLSCNCLKQVHSSRAEWQSAFQMQEEENALKNQLSKNLLQPELSAIRFKEDLKRLQKEKAFREQQLADQQSWSEKLLSLQWSRIYVISTLLGVSLLFLLILYRLLNSKKRNNAQLQVLNHRLNNTNNLLEKSNEELNQSNDTLLQTNQALNNFATVAAHDLKGPLRSINSFTQLLQRSIKDKIGERELEYFKFINSSARKLTTLIDDLLAFSRLGKKMPPPIAIDLNSVVKDIIANYKQAIVEKDIEIDLKELPIVLANYSLMMQVFQNLISNSIKFADENKKSSIKISAFPLKTNRIQVAIEDNGIGIPADQQEQVFELFTRLNSAEKYEGSGVGLATCRKIVQHYGGKIGINSKEGKGTGIYFDLPLFREQPKHLHVITVNES